MSWLWCALMMRKNALSYSSDDVRKKEETKAQFK